MPEVLTKMDQLLQLLGRESATTTPALDTCPSTSAAILVTLAMESVGRLGREGSELVDQLATSVVGGRDGGAMAKKGICKQRFSEIVSVTSQVAISRRVHRYKLALRTVKRREGGSKRTGG